MIEGFINLSLPLKRLGFIKVIVWLTQPSSYMYTTQLVTRYKETVKRYRVEFEWNIDPVTGLKVAGSGIGKVETPANSDAIAVDHVLLAQNLGFIRREVNIWRRFGWHLASLYLGEKGRPTFLDPLQKEEMFKSEGFVARLMRSEQFVFCNALLSSDVDGSFPLIETLGNGTVSDLREQYFEAISRWYERKSQLETNPTKRYFYLKEKTNFAKKKNESGYSKIHKESQLYPRLHFLRDVGFITKKGSNYKLTDFASEFRNKWLSLNDKEVYQLLDEKESNLGIMLATHYNKELDEITYEDFENAFNRIATFYKFIGLIMIPYEDLYFSIAASALSYSKALSFSSFKRMIEKIAKERDFDLSTNMPGRRYIRT